MKIPMALPNDKVCVEVDAGRLLQLLCRGFKASEDAAEGE